MIFGRRKLLRDGTAAEAVVIGLGGGSQRGALFKVQLRVTFADGSKVEIWRRKGNAMPWVVEGDTIPVRYDAADHAKIEIDRAAWQARADADRAARKAAAIRDAETPRE